MTPGLGNLCSILLSYESIRAPTSKILTRSSHTVQRKELDRQIFLLEFPYPLLPPAKVLRYLTFVLDLARILTLISMNLYTSPMPFLQGCSIGISDFNFFFHFNNPHQSVHLHRSDHIPIKFRDDTLITFFPHTLSKPLLMGFPEHREPTKNFRHFRTDT